MVEEITEAELQALQDTHFLTLKKSISKKIVRKLAETEEDIKQFIKRSEFPFPAGTKTKTGKISKGENYRGFPYFVLDFPGLLTQDSVFTYRTMVWWGHEISFSLHLQGKVLDSFRKCYENKAEWDPFYISIGNSPWEYYFEDDNFQLIKDLDEQDYLEVVRKKDFIKIAIPNNLSELARIPKESVAHLDGFLQVLR